MLRLTAKWAWLATMMFFFAWLFVIHGVGLVLHEVAGHGLAQTIVGCGIGRFNLTYFGRGSASGAPCAQSVWLWTTLVIIDWAGLAVTLITGAAAMAFQRRAGLTSLTRLLAALFATHFLVGDLAYATSGGYYEVNDPARTAVRLEHYGLHVLAWLPPLVLFAATALYGARAIVGALREHLGSRTRLHLLKQSLATLGAAELLYFVAARIESAIRTDVIPSVVVAAEQRAVSVQKAPWIPIHLFPINRVLIAIAVVAFVVALARPVAPGDGGQDAALPPVPRQHAVGVAVAALVCVVAITLLGRV
jgi:hypothetical protein